MNRTQIEWVKNPDGSQGYTWNPITGCLNHTDGLCKGGNFPCYAYKLANGRLKSRYLANSNWCHWNPPENGYYDPFYPRFWEERLEIYHHFRFHRIRERQRYRDRGIFVCDMGDLFGIGIPSEWTERVLEQIKLCPNDRFYLLTKQPQNLIKFSPFPDNCFVGVTATNEKQWVEAQIALLDVKATIRYISFEPLLERMEIKSANLTFGRTPYIHWLIIGACTGSACSIGALIRRYPDLVHKPLGNLWTAQPRIEWVREIIEACQKANIPYFLKDNLRPLLGGSLVQDMPKGVEIGH